MPVSGIEWIRVCFEWIKREWGNFSFQIYINENVTNINNKMTKFDSVSNLLSQ